MEERRRAEGGGPGCEVPRERSEGEQQEERWKKWKIKEISPSEASETTNLF